MTHRALTVPYYSHLSERIEPGQTLTVRGHTPATGKLFSINFHKSDPQAKGDIPLHLSFRYDEKKVVINSLVSDKWGKEERETIPFKKESAFDIRIRAHDNKFVITNDGKHVHDFEYRLPLSSITYLSVDGDVSLTNVHWGGKYYPIPYETGFAQPFSPGKQLTISGTPEKKCKKLTINLLQPNGDKALHFDVRMDDKVVVRNAQQSGHWGNEEREGKLPFEKGHGFDLVIQNEQFSLQVFVNGNRFCTFAHRSDPATINGLQIHGDVEITEIQMV